MIDSCFSIRSDHLLAFIARLKHTNSGKKASCARQNAAFTPRKSIRSTIIRYDIGFRTTLQKNNTQKTKNNMLGSARNRGKSGKIGRLPFGYSFSHSTPGSKTLKNRGKSEKIGRLPLSDVRFSTRIPVRKCSEQEQTPKKPVPSLSDVVFPTKIPDYRVNNNYANITKYVKLRYFL